MNMKVVKINPKKYLELGLTVREATRKPATDLEVCTWLNKTRRTW